MADKKRLLFYPELREPALEIVGPYWKIGPDNQQGISTLSDMVKEIDKQVKLLEQETAAYLKTEKELAQSLQSLFQRGPSPGKGNAQCSLSSVTVCRSMNDHDPGFLQ